MPDAIDVSLPRDARESRPDQLLLSAESLAELLDVSKRTLWRLRSAGRLPKPVRIGGSVRWRADEVRRWIASGCPPLSEWDVAREGGER